MAAHDYADFDGWTVIRDDARNAFDFIKPHPKGKPGPDGIPRLVVAIRGGVDTDPDLVWERGVRDCYAEEMRVAPDDPDVAAKFREADKAVTLRKVRHGLAKGFPREYAVQRLTEVGFTFAEMGAVLGEEG